MFLRKSRVTRLRTRDNTSQKRNELREPIVRRMLLASTLAPAVVGVLAVRLRRHVSPSRVPVPHLGTALVVLFRGVARAQGRSPCTRRMEDHTVKTRALLVAVALGLTPLALQAGTRYKTSGVGPVAPSPRRRARTDG
jgi:hypothetical protein